MKRRDLLLNVRDGLVIAVGSAFTALAAHQALHQEH